MTRMSRMESNNMYRSQAQSRRISCALRHSSSQAFTAITELFCALISLILVNLIGMIIIIT